MKNATENETETNEREPLGLGESQATWLTFVHATAARRGLDYWSAWALLGDN